MKIETLRLKGVLRFKDEQSLDFRELPAGLIAFVGGNGEGKSTTLEAPVAGLYREFPSRSDKEILDYVHGTDAFIESTFEMEGVGLFRSRLALDGPHRKSEAILTRILPDGTQAILNDGKLTTYDKAVAEVLPPKALLLASVFAAQNRSGSFSALDRKGRRQLFATLLGLEHMQTMAERARQAASLVQQALEKLAAVRDVLARETGETVERDLEQRAQQLQVDGGQVEARRVELQRELSAIEQELASLQEAAAAYATARAQADRLDKDLATAQAQLDDANVSLDRHASDLSEQRAAIGKATTEAVLALSKQAESTTHHRAELHAILAGLTKVCTDADERIANNRKLLADADTIQAAIKAIAEIDQVIASYRAQQQADARRVDDFRRHERVLRESLAAIDVAERDLARAVNGTHLLTTVPFGEKCEQAACAFLLDAITAKAGIPALREVVETKPATVEALRGVEAKIAAIGSDALRYQQQIAALEAERTTHDAHARRLSQLETASQRIKDLEQQKVAAQAAADEAKAAAIAREKRRIEDLRERYRLRDEEGVHQLEELERRMAVRHAELTAAVARLTAHLRTLTVDRQALDMVLTRHGHASASASAQQALLVLRRKEWDETTATLARVTSQREDLERRRADLIARRAQLAVHDARRAQLDTDLIEWTLLAKALGREGLQTLEIDDAGPAVSKYANDLLESCYGSRFAFELITQEPLKSKSKDGATTKEVFELRIFDAKDGIWKDLGDLSGGERVIVEEVLRSAIALLVNRRNVQPLRTLWRDECAGALDPENATRYIAMLRKLQELGGYWQILIITHSPDCAQQCDAQVQFANGQLETVLPPYAASVEAA